MAKKAKSPAAYTYDVFISYSSKDKVWVRGELLKRIEKAGLKAFIDYRDFDGGAPSIEECQRGVLECRKTLLVLTPNYIASEWTKYEALMVQTKSPSNRDRRLIPLLKAKCEKPLSIGMLTHIDFTEGADFDLAWRQLLTSLGKPPELVAPKTVASSNWYLAHPYPMPPNFTGREAERRMLTNWLNTDAEHTLLSLRALGGFGKSALVWHWLTHDVQQSDWPCVVWWSFYEGDASFENFLLKTLEYLSGGEYKSSTASLLDVRDLLEALTHPGTLLVLDGFERALRAFSGMSAAYQGDDTQKQVDDCDCVSILADTFLRNAAILPEIRSKILLTTRLTPRSLEARGGGLLVRAREEELLQMQPDDAVKFFAAQGIRGTHAEIEQACAPYGYHPLSLRLLAGLIVRDLEQPGDIAAASHLDVSGDLVQRQHHVLELAYDCLTPDRKKLLSQIACFRSPVKLDALKAIAKSEKGTATDLNVDLGDLLARGLLHHDRKENRFDLHPIVRRYAYDRLSSRDKATSHTRMRDYFAAIPEPSKVETLDDFQPVIELYHHTVKAGKYDEAHALYRDRISDVAFYRLGSFHVCIDLLLELFPEGEANLPRLKDQIACGWTLNELGNAWSRIGSPRKSIELYDRARKIAEAEGNLSNVAACLLNAADAHMQVGDLRDATNWLHRAIEICVEPELEDRKAASQRYLGKAYACRGDYSKAEELVSESIEYANEYGLTQWLCTDEFELVHCCSLSLRSSPGSKLEIVSRMIECARLSLSLAEEHARAQYPYERDFVVAHWLFGAAHRVAGNRDEAEQHLNEALERCRRINLVEVEGDILIDLARLRAATGAPDEAKRLAEEALAITERCEYVLQGADAHLELAKLALAKDDKATALEHARKAKELAFCDGPPDYTYKAAYDEALDLLKKLEKKR